MAIKASAKVEPSWYVLEDEDPDSSQATRFKIRPLTSGEQLEVLATFREGRPTMLTWRACFERGVMEIQNVEDADGKPVRFAAQLLALPDLHVPILEVGAKIFDISWLTEDERKN